MKEPKKQAVLYVRVNSTVEEAEKQLEELWKFAESKGFTVTSQYYEIISGASHVHGRTMWHMLHDAEQHKFDTVIIKDISRISRKMQDTLFVLNILEELGIKLIAQYGNATLLPLEVAL